VLLFYYVMKRWMRTLGFDNKLSERSEFSVCNEKQRFEIIPPCPPRPAVPKYLVDKIRYFFYVLRSCMANEAFGSAFVHWCHKKFLKKQIIKYHGGFEATVVSVVKTSKELSGLSQL